MTERIEVIRRLGINIFMQGTGIMERLMQGEITANDLSLKEIDMLLAAWDTRHYVPRDKIKDVDRVKPNITKEEVALGIYSEEEYKRDYAEQIEKYLNVIM